MDEKGRRFADDEKIIRFKDPEQDARDEENAKHEQDKRLKDKNAKKLKKLLKKQKRKELRARKKFPDEEDIEEERAEEPKEQEIVEDAAPEQDPSQENRDPDNGEEVENNDEEIAEDKEIPAQRPAFGHVKKEPPSKKKKFPVKRIIAVAVIIVILFVVVFAVFNSDRFSVHNISNFFKYGVFNQQSEEKFPLDIKGERVNAGNFDCIGQDICYVSDTKTATLNNYGRTLFTEQHAFINPVLTVSDKGALVYNLGGIGYQLIDKEGTVYSAEAKDNLLTADFADNGVYALVTQSSGYLSKLYVYNEENEQIFAYSFADYYVTSVTLDSSGAKAVVSGLSALNGVENSALYVLDFTQEKPLAVKEIENDIIYQVKYLSDKYVCAVGHNASYVLNTGKDGDLQTNSYEGRALTAFDINDDTNTYTVSLSSSGDGRNCDILSYSTAGNSVKSFSVDKKIINISTYKGRVALLTGDSVMLYSKDGKSYSEKELNSDPHTVVMYTSSDAYVLCTGYIDSVSL
nr:DUF5711 family protein [uncultured Ruminococcus sp.]